MNAPHELTTTELREELARRKRILTAAQAGTGSTAELERGISNLQAELRRRDRYCQAAPSMTRQPIGRDS